LRPQQKAAGLDSPPHSLVSSFLLSSPLSSVIIHNSFSISPQAQNLPFQQILPTLDFFCLPDCLHDNGTGPDLPTYLWTTLATRQLFTAR